MLQPDMWLLALKTMPQVDKSRWQTLDIVAKWLIASRASVLVMTFTSCAIGGILAWQDGLFNGYYFCLTLLGLLLAHATNNQLNDLTDTVRGIDNGNYFRNHYGTHVLEHGLMTRKQLLKFIYFTGALALLLGATLVFERGGITLQLLAAGAFFVLFYTYPLKYIGLGEPAVLLVWGPLMIGGTYYVVTGHWSSDVALLSLLYALGPTSVLFGKHTDKLDADKAKGVRSLPVLIGEKLARYSVLLMVALQYVLTIYIVIAQLFSPAMLIVFVNATFLPSLWAVYKAPRPTECPPDYLAERWPLWFSAYAFAHTRKFSGLFLIGLMIDGFIR